MRLTPKWDECADIQERGVLVASEPNLGTRRIYEIEVGTLFSGMRSAYKMIDVRFPEKGVQEVDGKLVERWS